MKSKKWLVITIISLVLVVLEVTTLFVVILPTKKVNDVFKALEAGNGKEAKSIHSNLSDSGRDKVKEYMDDFAVYQCNQYIDGKIDYDKLDKMLSAIDKLGKNYDDFSEPYYAHVIAKEMLNLYEQGYTEYTTNGRSSLYYDLSSKSDDIYWTIWDNDDTDEVLKDYLKVKYDSFLAGDMDYKVISDYVDVAIDFYHGSALSYAYDIDSDLYYIESYQRDYETAKEYYDNEQYFEAIEACDDVYIYEDDTTGYYEKFKQLRQDAYDAGKTYYISKAQDYINAGDAASAKELVDKIKEVYGDEVDVSSIESQLKDPWMDAYAQYVANAVENLKRDAATGIKIGQYDDTSKINVDDYVPTDIYLYDFDGNGTPEMLLANDSYAWIIGFDGTKAVLTGFLHAAAFCDRPYIATIPTDMPEGYSGYEILQFSNNEWQLVTYYIASDDGDSYEVDGASVSYEECSAKFDEIAAYENEDVHIDYGDYIEYYEDVIYNYIPQ